nr:Chain C, Peptide from Ubiquitin fusion degradation protein 1 [Saccharomyces cerevisiae S288C]
GPGHMEPAKLDLPEGQLFFGFPM